MIQGSTPYIPTAVQIDGSAVTVAFKTSSGHNSSYDIVIFDILNNNGTYLVLADVYGGY